MGVYMYTGDRLGSLPRMVLSVVGSRRQISLSSVFRLFFILYSEERDPWPRLMRLFFFMYDTGSPGARDGFTFFRVKFSSSDCMIKRAYTHNR